MSAIGLEETAGPASVPLATYAGATDTHAIGSPVRPQGPSLPTGPGQGSQPSTSKDATGGRHCFKKPT